MVKIQIQLGTIKEATQPDCIQALMVEFITTFLFIFAGVGSAITSEKLSGDALVGLFFVGMAQTLVVAVMIGAGGHFNPAVTLGLLVGGHITMVRSILYWIHQLIASASACYLLHYLSGGLTTPVQTLASGVGYTQGVVCGIVLTFSLLFTVYATMVDPKKGVRHGLGPTLVGFVVGANILAGAFSGASINPARSFGPALVSGNWTDHWVYWVGPLIGGGFAGFIYENFFINRAHAPLVVDEESY